MRNKARRAEHACQVLVGLASIHRPIAGNGMLLLRMLAFVYVPALLQPATGAAVLSAAMRPTAVQPTAICAHAAGDNAAPASAASAAEHRGFANDESSDAIHAGTAARHPGISDLAMATQLSDTENESVGSIACCIDCDRLFTSPSRLLLLRKEGTSFGMPERVP